MSVGPAQPALASTSVGADHLIAELVEAGVRRRDLLALALRAGVGLGLTHGVQRWAIAVDDPVSVVAAIERELEPRWVWWSNGTAVPLIAGGLRVGRCWDLAAVHRLLHGGWKADPARVFAALHGLRSDTIPAMGQLDLLGSHGDDGTDFDDPVRPDGHLRPEWVAGGWATDADHLARWASTALLTAAMQRDRLQAIGERAVSTAHAESAAELLCAELEHDGLPVDVATAEQLISASVGPRPRNEEEAVARRDDRDRAVLAHALTSHGVDLRNPAHVKAMLARAGIEVANTRAWRLEALRDTSPLVDALLTWRKAERIATTYGYAWLDSRVGSDGRLRGSWTGSDGAAGRMTAQAGLHNMPADLRPAVAAEPGHVLVRADLGQIEPRVLAAVSGDTALAAAAQADDLYAPVAAKLGVERATAKVAVLAAMYGQTSGTAGQALRDLEAAYPVAMRYLHDADGAGQAGRDVRTYGGRLVRMWEGGDAAAASARGRYARNAVVQGAAAELFKMWAVTVRARGADLGARIVLCLHDELLVHAPADRGEETGQLVERCLHEASARWGPGSGVRFVADVQVVERWSDVT